MRRRRRCSDLDGEAMRYNRRDTVLNPYFLAYGDPERDWLAWPRPDAFGQLIG